MTLKSFFRYTLLTSALSVSALATADEIITRPFNIETEQGTVTAIKPDIGLAEAQDKAFTFDWNQFKTLADNKGQIRQIEKTIAKIDDVSKLNALEQQALASLLYKLGTYYTHIARDPDSAITKLTSAAPLFNTKEEKAWNDNQLALAYEQRYTVSKQSADKEKSLYYTNQVLSQLYPKAKNKITAFANCVKGLISSDDKNYTQAEQQFRTALAIYDAIPNSKDNQLARIKNRLANAMMDQPNRQKDAIAMMIEVKRYWAQQGSVQQNPYAARNLISLGHAYMITGNPKAARDQFKMAVNTYKNVYGEKSPRLAKAYQSLAESYRKLGSQEQAAIYDKKAQSVLSA